MVLGVGPDVGSEHVALPSAQALNCGIIRSCMSCRGGSPNTEAVSVELVRIVA